MIRGPALGQVELPLAYAGDPARHAQRARDARGFQEVGLPPPGPPRRTHHSVGVSGPDSSE